MIPHILIVDDNPETLNIISTQVTELGYTCDTASCGADALELVSNDRFHLLLTELDLPKMCGVELISTIKKSIPSIIAIVMSEKRDVDQVLSSINEFKAFDFVNKPISSSNLKRIIDRAFDTYNLRLKFETHKESELKLFKDMYKVFDWKKELRSVKTESLANTIIRQLNIGFLHGGGIGGLLSTLSLVFSKAKLKRDSGIYEIPEKLFKMAKGNYEQASRVVRSFTEAQKILMDDNPYEEMMPISEVYNELKELAHELKEMLYINEQRLIIGDLPLNTYSEKCINFNLASMRIAIKELLINAMKYSGKGDTIFLIFFIKDSHFEIKILNPATLNSDNTLGITPNNETNIFEPFFRLRTVAYDTYTAEDFGSGLGLTVVKKIIDRHRANISIYTLKNHSRQEVAMEVCAAIRFHIHLISPQEKRAILSTESSEKRRGVKKLEITMFKPRVISTQKIPED